MILEFDEVEINTPSGDHLLSIPSARVESGISALTGPNGAGKSTLLRTIMGLHPLAAGRIAFDGTDSRNDRRKFLRHAVFQFQNFVAYPELTGREFLVHSARLRGMTKSAAKDAAVRWTAFVGLGAQGDSRTSTYSQGMLQRLGFAHAMQSAAPLCILDEPFAGVDPEGRAMLGQLLRQASGERIILICTHHVDEMEELGAKTVEIANGRLNLHSMPAVSAV